MRFKVRICGDSCLLGRAQVAHQSIQLTAKGCTFGSLAPGDDRSAGQRRGNPEVGQVPHRPVLRSELLHTAAVCPQCLELPREAPFVWYIVYRSYVPLLFRVDMLVVMAEAAKELADSSLEPMFPPSSSHPHAKAIEAPAGTRDCSLSLSLLSLLGRSERLSLACSQRRDSPSSARPRTSTCSADSPPRASRHCTLTGTAEGIAPPPLSS